jgi:prepilin-type processing-associated H-X9-DG protein
LLPALNRARAQSQVVACLSNLRQVGLAFTMYASEHHNYVPYPTTTLTEGNLWFDLIDPYIKALVDTRRSGVAGGRSYAAVKQDPVWQSFPDLQNGTGQGTLKENSRTYKMNTYLRHQLQLAKLTDVHHSEVFVLAGDSTGYDVAANPSDTDSSRFSFQVGETDSGDAYVYLRHRNTANIVFCDGHAANMVLPMAPAGKAADGTTALVFSAEPALVSTYRTWYGEFLDSTGKVVFPYPITTFRTTKPESLGYTRNPNMPLRWCDPPAIIN